MQKRSEMSILLEAPAVTNNQDGCDHINIQGGERFVVNITSSYKDLGPFLPLSHFDQSLVTFMLTVFI